MHGWKIVAWADIWVNEWKYVKAVELIECRIIAQNKGEITKSEEC